MKRLNRQMSFLLLLTLGLAAVVGCGTETYNRRLDETRKLFNYINRLNENLGTLWSNAGVEIRMPRQFTEIPPPQMIRNENGELVQDGPDERQPDYSQEELPGLIGAWKGSVEAEVAGEYKQVPAYAYIMSNGYLWAKGEQEEASNFKNTVAEAVMDGLNLPLFDEEDWKREDYPPTRGFVPQQSANVWVTKTDTVVDETRAEISLHLFQNGDIQIAVLFVYPETISPSERITERINLALETIKISPEIPSGVAPTTTEKPEGTF